MAELNWAPPVPDNVMAETALAGSRSLSNVRVTGPGCGSVSRWVSWGPPGAGPNDPMVTARTTGGRLPDGGPTVSVSSACVTSGVDGPASIVSRTRAVAEPSGDGSTPSTSDRVTCGGTGSAAPGAASALCAPVSPLTCAVATAGTVDSRATCRSGAGTAAGPIRGRPPARP